MPNLGIADVLAQVWTLAVQNHPDQAADLFERVLPQMLFGLQNPEMYLLFEKRLLVERGVLSDSTMLPISFSPSAELVARGDFLNRRVAAILEQIHVRDGAAL
jgi:4-hydroxy-tetrahydrodipicolinate synthase